MAITGNRTRKTYSFKSSGEKLEPDEVIPTIIKRPSIGIQTPLRLGTGDGLFAMHTDMAKQLSDNLRNLILTNHGERLGFYDFGANLRPLMFELGSESADKLAIERIKTTTSKYMPFIDLSGFKLFIDHHDNKEVAKVGIQITYKIPRIDNYMRSLEVMLYVGG